MVNLWDIVNGAQLPRFSGKKVSVLGYVTERASNGMSFDIRAVDNVIVKINLSSPLERPIEGYVQVMGTSQGKSVLAENYIIFNNEKVDTKSHNTLCSLLYTVPNLWSMESADSMGG